MRVEIIPGSGMTEKCSEKSRKLVQTQMSEGMEKIGHEVFPMLSITIFAFPCAEHDTNETGFSHVAEVMWAHPDPTVHLSAIAALEHAVKILKGGLT